MNRRIKGLRNKAFLKATDSISMSRKTPPPHRNPKVALPRRSDINQEKAMTKNRRKNKTMKLMIVTKISMLKVLDRLLTVVSFSKSSLVST
jgi:hypothetical protein